MLCDCLWWYLIQIVTQYIILAPEASVLSSTINKIKSSVLYNSLGEGGGWNWLQYWSRLHRRNESIEPPCPSFSHLSRQPHPCSFALVHFAYSATYMYIHWLKTRHRHVYFSSMSLLFVCRDWRHYCQIKFQCHFHLYLHFVTYKLRKTNLCSKDFFVNPGGQPPLVVSIALVRRLGAILTQTQLAAAITTTHRKSIIWSWLQFLK